MRGWKRVGWAALATLARSIAELLAWMATLAVRLAESLEKRAE